MKKEDQHQTVLEQLYQLYLDEGIDKEFIWDGPSDWRRYETSTPRIVFLAKEAHDSFHPSEKTKIHDRFTRSVAKWALLLRSIPNIQPPDHEYSPETLQEAYDSIAIIELKKIDGENRSSNKELKRFTWMGQTFLKKQLEVLDPHIIVCLGTIEYYDIIYNFSDSEKVLNEKEIYSNYARKCWISNNRIVIQSYHPSYIGKTEDELFFLIRDICLDKNVQSEFAQIIMNSH